MEKVLVTGASGYVGQHLLRELRELGISVVAFDINHSGVMSDSRVKHIQGDLTKVKDVENVFLEGVDTVFHLGALKSVSESISKRAEYFEVNLMGTKNLVESMKRNEVKNLVFASSAAVYGNQEATGPIAEDFEADPQNPYGQSKLEAEKFLRECASRNEIKSAIMRFFNVGGSITPDLRDKGSENIFPIIMECVSNSRPIKIFQANSKTEDGSCVRDFVHPADIASALIASAGFLEQNHSNLSCFNIGSGIGTSVIRLMKLFSEVSGVKLEYEMHPGREGEVASVVSDITHARKEFLWEPKRDIVEIVESVWNSRLV